MRFSEEKVCLFPLEQAKQPSKTQWGASPFFPSLSVKGLAKTTVLKRDVPVEEVSLTLLALE